MPSTKEAINDGFTESLTNVALSPVQKQELKDDFTQKQNAYSTQLVNAFSSSLHVIFMITSSMMLLALILVSMLKERTLHHASPLETPGEI
jgi:hypothetical protein